MDAPPVGKVTFYPVLHLMTGPPGLVRNGGIWKKVKARLRSVSKPPKFMVQTLHFASYGLSDRAWKAWFDPWCGVPRIRSEMDSTFGKNRDLFSDSGGFQLLHASQIDLSRWGMEFTREDILQLQLKFAPTRIASLDAPLLPASADSELRRLTTFSLDNAVWLGTQDLGTRPADPIPYLVVHGRNPSEVRRFLRRLEDRITPRILRTGRYSLALGSQVPLAGSPDIVVANSLTVIRWMKDNCAASAALHIFGVGDAIAGEIRRSDKSQRGLSYDNSTYVQNAFRLRVFDQSIGAYRAFNPSVPVSCDCAACRELHELGGEFVSQVMSAPAYTPFYIEETRVNRSDILALVALHNLSGWRRRVRFLRPGTRGRPPPHQLPRPQPLREDYSFPLKSFEPMGKNLLLLPCSKFRPYSRSPSHRKVLKLLESKGFRVEDDFDRITLSGFYGPVHWRDEELLPVMSYDFRLTPIVDDSHLRELRYRTACVLNVIQARYDTTVAYLRSAVYEAAFGHVLRSFNVSIARDVTEVARVMDGYTPLPNS
jgi:7-cyano-7-deazaguanine tRNA-ribosyltransferase